MRKWTICALAVLALLGSVMTASAQELTEALPPEAQKLLDGLTPAAILEEMDDEEERSRTAKLLSSESGAGEQELRMVADYLRVLEKKRKENEIKALKEKMSTQQGEEKRGTLIKIQELLAQENRTGRRE